MLHGQKRSELILYLVLWAILYAAPGFSLYVNKLSAHTSQFDWAGLLSAWRLLSIFFAAFCIHNFLVAPLLVYRNRSWLYGCAAVVLIASFLTFQSFSHPHPNGEKPPMKPMEETMMPRPGNPPDEIKPLPPKHGDKGRIDNPHAFGGQDSVALIIVCLLFGLNVGAKYYFKSVADRKRFEAIERNSLNAQLSYLKYQINPHFFMNTLNNIHALVLIDPEKANRMIETLSKLMRYVLYDGNRSMAPLQKELSFVEHYVELMRVRFTENVRIDMEFPAVVPDVSVPSLLFGTFIENAFKHGVSYESGSFIEIRFDADADGVRFTCRNSRLPEKADSHGGVGLDNARKRLQLIYGNEYTLDIHASEKEYCVMLTLPVRK